MSKKAKRKDRTIFTPTIETADLANDGDALTYWKQILPESEIQYSQGGKNRSINFDASYHHDLIDTFRSKGAIDQVCFQLADAGNGHGRDFDPERQRAEVLDMATLDDLPADVRAKVGDAPGLYAKMKFFSKKAARAVRENPNLGVSARVRENYQRSDGQFVRRGIIHVLGTIDPRVPGMSGWQATDLSYDPDHGYVLDLSNESYEGAPMAKKNGKKGASAEGDVGTLPTDDEIDAMTDEELDQFLADGRAELERQGIDMDALDGDDEDDTDGDDEDDDTDDDEDSDADDGAEDRTPVGASLSNATRRRRNPDIDMANAAAQQANERANRALKAQAEAEFANYRREMILAGVPAADLDLAQPVLARPDDMVVDLSVTGEDDVNVAEIVRDLLEARRGTVDMSNESGHSGSIDLSTDDTSEDDAFLEEWSNRFGD